MMLVLNLLGLLLFPASVYTQLEFGAVVPDLKFDNGNDRYDLTSMIRATNRMFHENEMAADEDDYRRNIRSNEEDLNIVDSIAKDKTRYMPAATRRFIKYRRQALESSIRKFMASAKNKDKRRMQNIMKHLQKNKVLRRNDGGPSPDDEVLMHYAMPIVMNIDGYLKVPLK